MNSLRRPPTPHHRFAASSAYQGSARCLAHDRVESRASMALPGATPTRAHLRVDAGHYTVYHKRESRCRTSLPQRAPRRRLSGADARALSIGRGGEGGPHLQARRRLGAHASVRGGGGGAHPSPANVTVEGMGAPSLLRPDSVFARDSRPSPRRPATPAKRGESGSRLGEASGGARAGRAGGPARFPLSGFGASRAARSGSTRPRA